MKVNRKESDPRNNVLKDAQHTCYPKLLLLFSVAVFYQVLEMLELIIATLAESN